jgi:hypothetical protein
MYWVNAAETHETFHWESGMRYQHSSSCPDPPGIGAHPCLAADPNAGPAHDGLRLNWRALHAGEETVVTRAPSWTNLFRARNRPLIVVRVGWFIDVAA